MVAVAVPPGKQSFIDPLTGNPLEFGTVQHFIPATFTNKLTWADEAQTTANPTTIVLDGAGQCTIWGSGLYRQILKDQHGVQIWDQVTGFVASGGGGGGDVFGPGASVPGHVVTWFSADGTQVGDGGPLGLLAALDTVNDSNFSGTPLGLSHGGTGGFDGPSARAALGLGGLAVLSLITSSYVTDFVEAAQDATAAMVVAGANMTIVYNDGANTLTFSAGGGGGGSVTGPGTSVNNEMVLFSGTSGSIIKNSSTVPSADGLTLISAANFAAMRTDLGLGTGALANTGTSGGTLPLLNGTNTWSAVQTLSLAPVFGDAAGTRTALALGALATLSTITASLISDPANVKATESLVIAASDETTALTTGVGKVTFFMPYDFTWTEVFAGNTTPSSSGAVQADVKKGGTTIFSTKPSIGASQNTSLSGSGSVAAVLSTTTALKGDKITIDITLAGTSATGLKVVMNGHRT